jgi:hypothetical protein
MIRTLPQKGGRTASKLNRIVTEQVWGVKENRVRTWLGAVENSGFFPYNKGF